MERETNDNAIFAQTNTASERGHGDILRSGATELPSTTIGNETFPTSGRHNHCDNGFNSSIEVKAEESAPLSDNEEGSMESGGCKMRQQQQQQQQLKSDEQKGTPTRKQSSKNRGSNPMCNVYIARLPANFSDDDLFKLVSPFGPLISARVMKAKASGEGRGYAFVLFVDAYNARSCIDSLNGVMLAGSVQSIEVRYAHANASEQLKITPSMRKLEKKQKTPATSHAGPQQQQQHTLHPAPFAPVQQTTAQICSQPPANVPSHFPPTTQQVVHFSPSPGGVTYVQFDPSAMPHHPTPVINTAYAVLSPNPPQGVGGVFSTLPPQQTQQQQQFSFPQHQQQGPLQMTTASIVPLLSAQQSAPFGTGTPSVVTQESGVHSPQTSLNMSGVLEQPAPTPFLGVPPGTMQQYPPPGCMMAQQHGSIQQPNSGAK